MPLPMLDLLLQQGNDAQKFATPGFNPNAPNPVDPKLLEKLGKPMSLGQKAGVGLNKAGATVSKGAEKLDSFINSPGGSFVMNLLAQQGFSKTPQSKLGAVGRAGLATVQQQAGKERAGLNEELIRSQIGLNEAKTEASGNVGSTQAASTRLGKLTQDLSNKVISPEDYLSEREAILQESTQRGFDNEKILRDEFSKRTKGITDSLTSVSQAEALLATSDNPIAELAAFVSLIQSIDNSTVREGELRNYGSVNGILEDLRTSVTRAKGDGAFSPEVRNNIEESLGALKRNLQGIHNGFSGFYGSEADRAGLSRQAVIGGPAPSFTGPAREQPVQEEFRTVEPPPWLKPTGNEVPKI